MISRIQVGSDISKRWFDAHILLGREELTARYANTEQGHKLFIEWVRAVGARKVHVCMEFTGGYETALALACKDAGWIVSIVDGAKIAHYRRSFSSSGASTDKKSACLLARYCKERRPEQWFPVPDEYRKLRELVRHQQRLIEDKTAWSCRAGHPVEDELVQAQRTTLIEVYTVQIQEQNKRIAEHVKAHPNLAQACRLLRTIPGIAAKSAHRILAEMGPVQNYDSAKALALAAGLVPIVIGSGQRVLPGKLPVYGNRELRNGLFFPALTGKRNGKGVGPFIQRVQERGTLKMTAVVAGMRKLAHVIYGVLSSQSPFDQEMVMKNP